MSPEGNRWIKVKVPSIRETGLSVWYFTFGAAGAALMALYPVTGTLLWLPPLIFIYVNIFSRLLWWMEQRAFKWFLFFIYSPAAYYGALLTWDLLPDHGLAICGISGFLYLLILFKIGFGKAFQIETGYCLSLVLFSLFFDKLFFALPAVVRAGNYYPASFCWIFIIWMGFANLAVCKGMRSQAEMV